MSRNFFHSKKSFDMPFSWIFSIIAGIVILLLAVYATTQFINVGGKIKDSEAGKQLTILLNPVVNGMSSAYATKITLIKETRISVNCEANNYLSPFGRQMIGFAEEGGLFKKWNSAGENISVYNKYIFSDNLEQGKTIYLFSKPFYVGFRVDDLIFMNLKNYCFISAPESVSREINNLDLKNINITNEIGKCTRNSVKVCFGFSGAECNVSVYGKCTGIDCENEYETGEVVKGGKKVDYFGSLMYGAIFASTKNYECNVQRLGKKANELAKVYSDKADLVKIRGCDSIIGLDLPQISSIAQNLTSSKLMLLYQEAKSMDQQNCDSNCKIYSPEKCD